MVKVTSVVPFGPGPTSHTFVSSSSPGFTGEVNLTPKSFKDLASPPPTALMIARAANPYVERPWRITPPNPAAFPIDGSTNRGVRIKTELESKRKRTDVQGVVVTAETVDDGLLFGGLLLDHVVGFAVFGDWLGCGRTSNEFVEWLASRLQAESEGGALFEEGRSAGTKYMTTITYIKLCVGSALSVDKQLLLHDDQSTLCC